MAISIAIVCEGPADQRTGCDLADRVVCHEVKWIEEEDLPHLREWRGFAPDKTCLLWSKVPKLAKAHRIRVHGHFNGEPGEPDAAAASRALRLLLTLKPPPDAVILLRDDDGQAERRRGLDQARRKFGAPMKVVVGLAQTKRECWVLAGFQPQDDAELQRLEALRKELGFNPCEKAHQLTAQNVTSKRSAKRVLDVLTDGDLDREKECWSKTDLATLRARGDKTGLTEYLKEVAADLVPLFRHGPNR